MKVFKNSSPTFYIINIMNINSMYIELHTHTHIYVYIITIVLGFNIYFLYGLVFPLSELLILSTQFYYSLIRDYFLSVWRIKFGISFRTSTMA